MNEIHERQIKSAIIFNTGFGDALQLIPLSRTLKSEGHHLTAIFTSNLPSEEIIEPLGLFHEILILRNDNSMSTFTRHHLFFFENIFIEHSSSSLKICLFACLISKRVVTNRSKWYLHIIPNLIIRKSADKSHLILQNLHLAFPDKYFDSIQVLYNLKHEKYNSNDTIAITNDFITVQICAANNSVDYKNWRIPAWIELFNLIRRKFPNLKIFLIGDKNEAYWGEQIMHYQIPNIESLIGKTTLPQLTKILSLSKMYLGLDSGSMHLAAMLGRPTLTLWGPTDPETLGYQVFNKKKYLDISNKLSCHPCLSWIQPNASLYNHPLKCPHRNCIQNISPELVFQEFVKHWEQNYPSTIPA